MPPGERKLREEPLQACLILTNVGATLAVRSFEVSVSNHSARAGPRLVVRVCKLFPGRFLTHHIQRDVLIDPAD
jgi:hypothetical protein